MKRERRIGCAARSPEPQWCASSLSHSGRVNDCDLVFTKVYWLVKRIIQLSLDDIFLFHLVIFFLTFFSLCCCLNSIYVEMGNLNKWYIRHKRINLITFVRSNEFRNDNLPWWNRRQISAWKKTRHDCRMSNEVKLNVVEFNWSPTPNFFDIWLYSGQSREFSCVTAQQIFFSSSSRERSWLKYTH